MGVCSGSAGYYADMLLQAGKHAAEARWHQKTFIFISPFWSVVLLDISRLQIHHGTLANCENHNKQIYVSC